MSETLPSSLELLEAKKQRLKELHERGLLHIDLATQETIDEGEKLQKEIKALEKESAVENQDK